MNKPKSKKQPPKESRLKAYSKYSSMAFQMIAVILLGTFGGIKLDQYFQSSPLCVVVLAPLSVILAMGIMLKEVIKGK